MSERLEARRAERRRTTRESLPSGCWGATLALTHAPACALFVMLRLGYYLESELPIWTWEHRLQP